MKTVTNARLKYLLWRLDNEPDKVVREGIRSALKRSKLIERGKTTYNDFFNFIAIEALQHSWVYQSERFMKGVNIVLSQFEVGTLALKGDK